MFHAPAEPESSLWEAENQECSKRNIPEGLSVILDSADDAVMLHALLDLLFPRRSLTGSEGGFITASELKSLRSVPVVLRDHELRSHGMVHIDRIVAAADYDSVPMLHRAIHAFKYKKIRGMSEVLGGLLTEASSEVMPFFMPSPPALSHRNGRGGCPTLCPVPLHWIRRFSRGFNQAELLAHEVGRSRGWEIQNLLNRTRWTGSQVGRHRRDRLVGVKDAFAIQSGMKIPMHVILVDDLSTTGATMNECAKVLKNAGVKNVEGLVLALG